MPPAAVSSDLVNPVARAILPPPFFPLVFVPPGERWTRKLRARGSEFCIAPEGRADGDQLILTDCSNPATLIGFAGNDYYYFAHIGKCLWWQDYKDHDRPYVSACQAGLHGNQKWHWEPHDGGLNIYTWHHPFTLTVAGGKALKGAAIELTRLNADWDSQKFDPIL